MGSVYGTEDFSIFLYSWVKMNRCQNVVELGTGLGCTSLWIAQAMCENGSGRISTLDHGDSFSSQKDFERFVLPILKIFGINGHIKQPREAYFSMLRESAKKLQIERHLKIIRGNIDIDKIGSSGGASYFKDPVEILFSDYQHDPGSILQILAAFLPHMASSSSIFIDSASTKLGSYLTLEQTVSQLNLGKIPRTLLGACHPKKRKAMIELVGTSRFTLVHMVESKTRVQNSTAWIKIDPVDLVSFPLDLLQG